MILGQLQTDGYAAAVFASRDGRTASEVAELVGQRHVRNAMLYEPVRRWELIQFEGALTWCLGEPAVMADQMDHLLRVSALPNVKLGIVPAFRPVSFTAPHSFHIYDAAVVQVGAKDSTALISKRDAVGDYATLFAPIAGIAVYGDEARDVLRQSRSSTSRRGSDHSGVGRPRCVDGRSVSAITSACCAAEVDRRPADRHPSAVIGGGSGSGR